MLLAAGLGTRLQPLTFHTPKPLIPVDGLPLIFYNLALLKKAGVKDVVINLHHLGGQIEKLLGSGKKFGFKFAYSKEKEILGTAGGIKKAQRFLKDGPFLVMNGDIIVDFDLKGLVRLHQSKMPLTSLVLGTGPQTKEFGGVFVNGSGDVVSILESPPSAARSTRTFFTGIHLIDPAIFRRLSPRKKLCIIRDGYIPALAQGEKIAGYVHKGYWNDLGTLDRLKSTERALKLKKIRLSYSRELKQFKKILQAPSRVSD